MLCGHLIHNGSAPSLACGYLLLCYFFPVNTYKRHHLLQEPVLGWPSIIGSPNCHQFILSKPTTLLVYLAHCLHELNINLLIYSGRLRFTGCSVSGVFNSRTGACSSEQGKALSKHIVFIYSLSSSFPRVQNYLARGGEVCPFLLDIKSI